MMPTMPLFPGLPKAFSAVPQVGLCAGTARSVACGPHEQGYY